MEDFKFEMDRLEYLRMKSKQNFEFSERKKILKRINPNLFFDDDQIVRPLRPSFRQSNNNNNRPRIQNINRINQINNNRERNNNRQRGIRRSSTENVIRNENEEEKEEENEEENQMNNTTNTIIRTLKVNRMKNVEKLSQDKKECIICLSEFKNGDKFICLPCIHIFHAYCIQNWLKTQKNCPLCKYAINFRE